METLSALVNDLNALVWGSPLLIPTLGTGLFLMVFLRFMPWLNSPCGFARRWKGRRKTDDGSGEISPFQARLTGLTAAIGILYKENASISG